MMEHIINYIKQKYNPISIVVYGSYANGTNNLNSDFDALVISSDNSKHHDASFVDDIQLDVFVYPVSYFKNDYDCDEFVQIFDGKIILDPQGIGKTLQDNVISYLNNIPQKTKADIDADVEWCIKMFSRVKRLDAEGMYRWHWLLVDSLEIFCNIMKHPYRGPKKALKWMEETQPDAFEYYKGALSNFNMLSLKKWIMFLKTTNEMS